MKTNIKDTAAFLAAAIWADGVYAESEKEILKEIAEALQIEESELTAAVDAEVEAFEAKNEEEAGEYLIEHASQIDEEEVGPLMECAIEIILADGVLTTEEVEVLFDLADATGVLSHAEVALMLADLAKHAPETEVKF